MSEPTNAERLRAMLVAAQKGTKPGSVMLSASGISHAKTNIPDTVEAIREGRLILISRERVESILAELESHE